MTTYILLRQNKESGPFTLEDLKAFGVLSDDLYWVEGQSVCWLNPREIRELKDLIGQEPVKPEDYLAKFQPAEKIPVVSESSLHSPASKKNRLTTGRTALDNETVAGENDPGTGTFYTEEKVVTDETETRYSKPPDEIKQIYLKNLERQQKRRTLIMQIPLPVKRAAPYAAFLIIGIATGVMINRNNAGKNKTVTEQIPVNRIPVSQPAGIPENPASSADSSLTESSETESMVPEKPAQEPDAGYEPGLVRREKNMKPPVTDKGNTAIVKTEERPASKRNPDTEPAPVRVSAEDISPLVIAKTNDYEVGSFGGIRNLQVTVKNDSRYKLDKVTVELKYLKPRDELLRTEYIYFTGVLPSAMQTQPVPKSSRGVKVTCRVVKIESGDAVPDTAGL